jgi:hypothetical protein
MKRIRSNQLITTPLYGAFAVIAQNRQSFFSTQFPSFLFTCIDERINVTDINTTIIIAKEVSTTIQLPK